MNPYLILFYIDSEYVTFKYFMMTLFNFIYVVTSLFSTGT